MSKAKDVWPRWALTMVGEKIMQEILNEPRQSLSIDDFFKLKKRFRRWIPMRKLYLARARERHERLMELSCAFTTEEKKWLLCMLVPHDMSPEATVADNWKTRTIETIDTVFMNRFEGQSIEHLRVYVTCAGVGPVPGGMVSAIDVTTKHEESLVAAIKALEIQRKAVRSQKNRIIKAKKEWENACKTRADGGASAIEKSIQYLLGKQTTQLYHDGCSTYAEPTLGGVARIAGALNIAHLTKDDIILDLGSGSAATLWHLCQYYGCRGIGVEYGEARLRTAAQMTAKLLNIHGANPTFNPQVINTYGNILHLDALPPCSVLYIYDEAFPDEVMEKIYELMNNAPPLLRCIITFKTNKWHTYRAAFEACRGFRAVSIGNRVNKAFSGEGSGFDVYERKVDDAVIVGNNLGNSSLYEAYWNGSLHAKIEYYTKLYVDMEQILNHRKAARTEN